MPGKRGSRMLAEIQAVDTEHSIFKNSSTPRKPLQPIDNNQQRTAPPPAKKRKSNDGIEICVDEAPSKMYMTPPASQPAAKPKVQRTVRGLPRYMLDVTTISLEEGLYSQAIALQSRSLESGLETNAPARIPPPQHVAFESTLTVHPTFNTKTIKPENKAASNDAVRYLRQLSKTANPKDADLKNAFHFAKGRAQSERSKRSRTRKSDVASDDEERNQKPGTIRSKYAEGQSLWNNAEDFWAVVGWAFNCSVKHKARWERWRVWLDQMLDVLQKDLEAYVALKEEQDVDFTDTMLYQYLSTVGHGRNNQRKIMRAVMADGSKTSMGLYPEIWKGEPKPPKKQKEEPPAKRKKLDIDNGEYGDYFDSDSDALDSEEGRKRRSRSATAPSTKSCKSGVDFGDEDGDESEDELAQQMSEQTIEAFGGQESIRLRQKFLTLLTRFSSVAPSQFLDASELFSLCTEFIRPLPVPVFQQFVLPIKPFLASNLQATFNEMLFQPLLGTNMPSYYITRQVLETSYAPHAAVNTTAADNAKISLLTESLLRSLWKSGLLVGDLTSLKAAIETGIKARNDKVGFDGRKKRNPKANDEVKSALECSAQRMRILLNLIEPQSSNSAQVLTISSSQSDFEFDCTVCGAQGRNLNDGSAQVACDVCNVWQHSVCHGISPEQAEDEGFDFVCDRCKMPT